MSDVKRRQLLRITGFGLLVFILFWLPIEDNALLWPLLLALLSGTWLGVFLFYRLVDRYSWKSWYAPLIGALSGAAVSVFAVALMLIKNGAHSHETPDYTAIDLLNILLRTPYWVLGGCLIGMGIVVFLSTQRVDKSTLTAPGTAPEKH